MTSFPRTLGGKFRKIGHFRAAVVFFSTAERDANFAGVQ